MKFHFRRHFRWAENEKCISVGLYVKLFQITPYVNDFQTLNNPGSGQPYKVPQKVSFTLHFDKSHPSSSSSSSSSSSRSPSEPLRPSMTPGDLRSPQRRSVERWHPSELVEPDVARATRRSSPAGHCLSAFVGTHHQAQSMMCWYSRVQACKMAKQIEISVNDVKCHQWLTNQIAEAPLHWRHESTSVSSICRWHLMWKASSVFMSATKRVYVSVP